MWRNSVRVKYLFWSILLVCTLTGSLFLLYSVATEGRNLQPDRREILVREVDNGYTILFRTANNPYAVKESVAYDATVAAEHVKQYLKTPIPGPSWGK